VDDPIRPSLKGQVIMSPAHCFKEGFYAQTGGIYPTCQMSTLLPVNSVQDDIQVN
jgi:hypothetical protein